MADTASHSGQLKIGPLKKGALHDNLGVPQGQKLTTAQLQAAKNSKDAAVRKRANFALNARKWSKK
jgi:hypothetical protein